MSKREQYGLVFYKKALSNGKVVPLASLKKIVPDRSVLIFISRLDKHDCEGFLHDLNRSISLQGNSDDGFFSDSVEHMNITYQYPNINIDNMLVISMEDMKGLLEEWLEFISS